MKIKSSVQKKETVQKKEIKPITFPAHFQSLHNYTVVLFFDEKHGIVVEAISGFQKVGEFREWSNPITSGNWNPVERRTTFKD